MTGSPAAASNGAGAEDRARAAREIAAEAAVWIARLHGPDRGKQMEQEFLAWQAASPAHREAFERCTDVWEEVPRIGLAAAYEALAARRAADDARGRRREALRRWLVASVVAAAVAAGVVLVQDRRGENVYATRVGEQRLVVLEDGSRVLMNTDTQLRVAFSAGQRNIDVRRGEAFFEVAKNPARPFVVHVAGSEVVAVGTAFSVRYAPAASAAADELAVTLVEGRVRVRAAAAPSRDALAPAQPVLMDAGQRLLLDRVPRPAGTAVVARIDRPDVERVMAWKRSEAIFNDTSLADAVAEMNRYNRTSIVLLDGLGSSGLRVSGTYNVDDSAGFANAVAAVHGLAVREESGRLELTKPH